MHEIPTRLISPLFASSICPLESDPKFLYNAYFQLLVQVQSQLPKLFSGNFCCSVVGFLQESVRWSSQCIRFHFDSQRGNLSSKLLRLKIKNITLSVWSCLIFLQKVVSYAHWNSHLLLFLFFFPWCIT